MMTALMREYDELIEFHVIDPIKEKKRGVKINNWLVIAKGFSGFKIYRIDTGKPALDVRFVNADDAIQMASMLDDIFGEYFDIWETYPDADVFSIAKWISRKGLKAHEMIKIIKEQGKITEKDDLTEAWENADETVWFGRTSRPAWG